VLSLRITLNEIFILKESDWRKCGGSSINNRAHLHIKIERKERGAQ